MPVRTVSSTAFAAVTEQIDGGLGKGNAKTATNTSVSADTVILNTASGASCTVHLDFAISSHTIGYGDKTASGQLSAKETFTVREHEYGHVGGRNALASSTLLTALCSDVKVKWTFSVKFTGNTPDALKKDQATLDATRKTYEGAVESFVTPIIAYLDEMVIHEAQRTAGLVGVPSTATVATLLAAISYTDPDDSTVRTPSGTVMGTAVTATKAGAKKGQDFASKNPAPSTVTP